MRSNIDAPTDYLKEPASRIIIVTIMAFDCHIAKIYTLGSTYLLCVSSVSGMHPASWHLPQIPQIRTPFSSVKGEI